MVRGDEVVADALAKRGHGPRFDRKDIASEFQEAGRVGRRVGM